MKTKWDKIFEKGYFLWKEPHPQIKRFVTFLKKRGVNKILDLGCGAGRHIIYFGKKGFIVVGLDISNKVLSIAQRRLEREKVKNCVLINHEMSSLPFPNEHFDAVVSINVIHHDKIKNIKKLLEK